MQSENVKRIWNGLEDGIKQHRFRFIFSSIADRRNLFLFYKYKSKELFSS